MLSQGLIKKSGLYFIGNISTRLLQFILLPIYAYYISTSEFGNYDLINSLANLFAPILFISIWDSILRFILSDNEKKNKQVVLSTAIIFSITIFIIITAVMCVYFYIWDVDYFILSLYFILTSYAFLSIWQYSARALKENKVYVIASSVSAIINFILSIVMLIALRMGITSMIFATTCGSIAGLLIIESKINVLKQIKFKYFDKVVLVELLKYSWPLVINALASWGITSACRIIISLNLGVDSNGLYAYANKFNQLIMIFGQIFSMAWLEEAIINIEDTNVERYFSNSIKSISRILIAALLMGGPMIAMYYKLIANTEYATAVYIFPILLIIPVIQTISTNIGAVFQAKNKTNIIFYTTLLGSIITITGSVIMVNKIGLISVVISQLLGMLAMLICRKIITNNIIRIEMESVFLLLIIAYYILSTYISIYTNMVFNIVFIVVNMLIAIKINYNNLKQVFNTINKRKCNNYED